MRTHFLDEISKTVQENSWKTRIFWILIGIILWEAIVRFGTVSPLLMPSSIDVAQALFEGVLSGELFLRMWNSLVIIFIGLGVGLVLAILGAAGAVLSKIFAGFTDTLSALAHPLPGVALLPLIIMLVGTGRLSIIIIVLHSVIWPMYITCKSGFSTIPKEYIWSAKSFELSSLQMLWKIRIPSIAPFALAGLRIGWARAWRAVISAEMIFGVIGTQGGIGWFIFQRRVFMDTTGMYSGLILLIIIGLVIEDILFGRLETVLEKRWGVQKT